jgi:hypothetical protein
MAERFDHARAHLEAARTGREEFSDRGTIVTSWSVQAAIVELLADEPSRAEAILAPTLEILRVGYDASYLALNSAWLAEAQHRQDRFAEALESSDLALSAAPRGYLTALVVAERVRAKALAPLGRLEEARATAFAASERLAGTDALYDRAETCAAVAEVLALTDDEAGAGRFMAEAIALFEEKGDAASVSRLKVSGKPG